MNSTADNSLLQLLLGSQVRAVTTGLLPAVGGPGVEPGVALPADHLVAVVPLGQDTQGRLDDSSSQSEHQVEGGLLLDVVIRQSPVTQKKYKLKNTKEPSVLPSILQLLAGKDQPLLIGRDPFLVLDLGLDILDGVRGLHLEGDGLAREGLDEDLHFYL